MNMKLPYLYRTQLQFLHIATDYMIFVILCQLGSETFFFRVKN